MGKLETLNRANLKKGLGMRAKAKTMADESKTIIEEANELLEPAMSMLDLKTYAVEGVGKVTLKPGTNVSLNKDKLREALLLKQVDYKVIEGAIKRATKTTKYTSVEFKVK